MSDKDCKDLEKTLDNLRGPNDLELTIEKLEFPTLVTVQFVGVPTALNNPSLIASVSVLLELKL